MPTRKGKNLHYFIESQKVSRDFNLGEVLKGHETSPGMEVTGILITIESGSPVTSPLKVKEKDENDRIPAKKRVHTYKSLNIPDHSP